MTIAAAVLMLNVCEPSPPVPQPAGDGGHRLAADVFAQPQLVQRADAVRHDHDRGARLPELCAAFAQHDLVPGPMQPHGGRHPSQAGTHHHDPHPLTPLVR